MNPRLRNILQTVLVALAGSELATGKEGDKSSVMAGQFCGNTNIQTTTQLLFIIYLHTNVLLQEHIAATR